MSELSGIEKQQEAPAQREPATGPLLPRWFTASLYVVFGVFSIYSAIYITRSLVLQRSLVEAVSAIGGSVTDPGVALESPRGQEALAVLQSRPERAFLYVYDELVRDEEEDGRMARALALHKAVAWGENSTRRELINYILSHIGDDGRLGSEFALDEQMQAVLERMVSERRANPDLTYVEDRITDVLEWIARGRLDQPKGPEKRRLSALQNQYAKRIFIGEERDALEALMAEWRASGDLERQAAAAFAQMLAGERVELAPEAEALCIERAEEWEQRYREGVTRAAKASRQLAEKIAREGIFLDHPHIFQYVRLLGHRFEEVREQIAQGAWALRHIQYTMMFLSYFATKTTINPAMAVETVRLTREERERLMHRVNERRMREAVRLLGRIGVDCIRNRSDYDLELADPDDFVRKNVVSALSEVADEEAIADLVEQVLDDMRQADRETPDVSVFDEEAGE
ncbi:MAG: HEAT repeat domain-containing protein [Planctomycetota bacterium]|jgi:hypothetical protein